MKIKACSRWGAIANPHAKVFNSPSYPQSLPGAWPWQRNKNSVQYVFYLIFVRSHRKYGIKIFEIDMLMITDLLTLPQGHQFDPRMKMLLAFCSACHPCRFDMLHDHVWKKMFDPLGTPSAPKSHPWAWPRQQNKNPVWNVLYPSFVRTHTKFAIKIFEIDMVTDIKWYLTFDLTPRSPVWPKDNFFYLDSVLLVIPVDLIYHMTMFEIKKKLAP